MASSESLKTGEDVDAILKIALRQEPGTTDELRSRLNRSAEEQYRTVGKIEEFMHAKRAGFKAHIVSFISVNILLHVIWLLTSNFGHDFYWPGIVLAAWGIGTASHYFAMNHRPSVNDHQFKRWLEMGEPSIFVAADGDRDGHRHDRR